MKIICAGLPKTGTTSMYSCFTELGFKTTTNPMINSEGDAVLQNHIIYKCDDNLDNNNMNIYDAFQDVPYSINYKSFYEKFGNDAFFILTVRDANSWFNSFCKYDKIDLATSKKFNTYFFGTPNITQDKKEIIIEKYNQYNNEFIEYFNNKKKDILVLDIEKDENKYEKIIKYLNLNVNIKSKFPHENKQTMIFIGSDHAGFELKSKLIEHFPSVVDCGTYEKVSCDYPDYAQKVCERIKENDEHMGILVCGTGIGISIAANRYPHIRCALCTTSEDAKLSREHNNANVLALGSKTENPIEIVETFIKTKFSNEERHSRRLGKIMRLI